jgi:hypothetical protein
MHQNIISPNVAVPGSTAGDAGLRPPEHLGPAGAQLWADVVRQYRIGDGAGLALVPRPRSASTGCGRRSPSSASTASSSATAMAA